MAVGEHYRGQREALSAFYAGLDERQLATVVPGCPEWTVRDLLAHLVGVPADVTGGVIEGSGGPAWTQAQVEARRSQSVPELLAEWERTGPAFEGALPSLGFLGKVLVWDVTMHGDDAREALGLDLGTTGTHAFVLDGLVEGFRRRAEGVAGTVRLVAGERSWEVGSGEPVATVVTDAGELGRVLGGRRSDEQVRALDWTGDPAPWLDALPLFRDGR